MIEFKAECGHTVRARDEDAGGVVRCSYCGKPANVPEETGDELDFLFNDIDQPDELPRSRRKRGRKKARTKRARAPGAFNPFAVVLKLCYAALLIAIVIFVGRKFVKPLFEPGGITKRGETDDRRLEQLEPEEPRETVQGAPAAPGLIDREHLGVLYVSSTPPGARVYVLEAAAAPAKGPIHAEPGAKSFRANQRCPYHLQDGEYVVDVALPPERMSWLVGQRASTTTIPSLRRPHTTSAFATPSVATRKSPSNPASTATADDTAP